MTMLLNQRLDKDTPEDRIAELVDSIKASSSQREALVELLPEQHPVYLGRGTNQTIRMRGYILAAFEHLGLPEQAVPYVLDELQNGRDAYLVAAAAKALRGLPNPSGELVRFLFKAVDNIRLMDDALTFEQYKPAWPLTEHTSALQEIFRSFGWLGSRARSALPDLEALDHDSAGFTEAIRREIRSAIDAIRGGEPARTPAFIPLSLVGPTSALTGRTAPKKKDILPDLAFEDQEGNRLTYAEFFREKPSIVVFFYTRCNNPNKCALTITKLGRLQQMIREERLEGRLQTAAITYDPEYDLPARLKAYGLNRGVLFGEDYRFFRALTGMHEVQEHFGLGVNFNGTIVNQHRIELFLLDRQGHIATTFARLQWDVREVLDSAKALLPES
jgi:protein SCO1/2